MQYRVAGVVLKTAPETDDGEVLESNSRLNASNCRTTLPPS